MTDPVASDPIGVTGGSARRVAVAVLGRPDLWWTALGAVYRLAAPGWWRTAPRLPVPDRRLWAFRMVTAYGRADAEVTSSDVLSYLEWCRSTAGSTRRPRGQPAGDDVASAPGPGQPG